MTVQPSAPLIPAAIPAEEIPPTVGAQLRTARERMGMSLADVATITRIPKVMLDHLEHDRFEEYAAPVFVRGHLTNYAREVRLDANKILTAFERQTGKTSAVVETPRVAKPQRARRERPSRQARPRRAAPDLSALTGGVHVKHVVMAVLILLGMVALVSFTTSERATAQAPAAFPTAPREDWSLEQDTRETRWLLEQPEQLTGSSRAAEQR